MQLNEKTNGIIKRVANYAFYLALSIELILVILDKSIYIIKYDGTWFRLTFVLFLVKVILTENRRREWAIISTFSLLGVISYLITGRNEILRIAVFVFACKDIKKDTLLKYVFYSTLMGCMILIVLSFFGVGTFSITRDFGRGEVATRYCLGLGHPNGLHCMYWSLSMLYLYIYRNLNKWLSSAVILVGNAGLFLLTDSRAGFLATIVTVLMFLVMSMKISSKQERIIVIMSYVGIGLSLIWSALMMSHKFFWSKLRRIDDLLTGRILWTHMDIMQAKTFFWRPFGAKGQGLETDLGLVKMFYWYGYVPTIIFAIVCCLLIRTAIKEGDKMALVVVVSIILYSIFEGHDVSKLLARNYIFILLGIYWTGMIGGKCIENSEADG